MSWWKRVGLAFLSALFAETFVIGVIAAFNAPGARVEGFLTMAWFALYFVVPGWLLSVPAVLWLTPATLRNLVVLAFIGVLIGPCLTAALDPWTLWKNPTFIARGPGSFEYLATAISIIATAIYLGVFKALSCDVPMNEAVAEYSLPAPRC